jgi:hypothetical protein
MQCMINLASKAIRNRIFESMFLFRINVGIGEENYSNKKAA